MMQRVDNPEQDISTTWRKFSEVWAVASRNSLYRILAISVALGARQRAKSSSQAPLYVLGWGGEGGDCYCELPRILIPRTPVNKGAKECRGFVALALQIDPLRLALEVGRVEDHRKPLAILIDHAQLVRLKSGNIEGRFLDQREHNLVAVRRPGRRGCGSPLRILEDLPEARTIRLHDPDRALRLDRRTYEDDLLAVGRPPGRRADVESGWGDSMQASTVHVHHVERPGDRISIRLGPQKDDLRAVWGEVHGYVVIGMFRQAG